MRTAAGIAAGAVVAAVAGLILGEYAFTGVTPFAAALIVPLAVGEAIGVAAGGLRRGRWLAAAALGAAGVGWGVWISTDRGRGPVPWGGWFAVAAAAVWPLVLVGVASRYGKMGGGAAPLPAPTDPEEAAS